MNDAPHKAVRPTLGALYAAMRQRTDVWRQLKTGAVQWAVDVEDEGALDLINDRLEVLARMETYWAYPGHRLVERMRGMVAAEDNEGLAQLVELVVRMLVSEAYRVYSPDNEAHSQLDGQAVADAHPQLILDERPYFEVLVVDAMQPREADRLRDRLLEFRRDSDPFVYDIVVVPSFEDAIIAVLLNQNLQSVVIRYGFPLASKYSTGMAERALAQVDADKLDVSDLGRPLGEAIKHLRPNLDLFLVSDANVEDVAGSHHGVFRRIFFRQEDLLELHQSLFKGVQARFHTPFFTALKNYSLRPTGVFHALPIARGKSVNRSHWIRDMEELYGQSLFMAETSATTGGLDSLLAPHGSLLDAQESAARAFGADHSFFVTNGTSTANKIVLQALATPGDIVLATRDCHMSHHYAFVLSGVQPVYMDPYPLRQFGFYGGVPIAAIKRELLALKARGELSRARVLLLTNCTFDGIVYNPQRVMAEILAIQPDMTFIWDEAWFAFAAFTPITRQRTAMASATALKERLASDDYRKEYAAWRASFDKSKDPDKWMGRLMPDPDVARVRVYATQSTHKTLTSLRQGSMIHIQDQDYGAKVSESFHQAYLTHTSSSANYPILASLDIGRRQVELEGYEMVHHAIELALVLRQRINVDPNLSRWFRVLTPSDLVPEEYRPSGFTQYVMADQVDWERMDDAWMEDEFCIDPTRITLFVGSTGIDGDQFKRLLIDEYDIQVNKTSTNTVLFMTHIGTTRGAVAHLIDALSAIAAQLTSDAESEGAHRAALREANRRAMTGTRSPLPNFSGFHQGFRDSDEPGPEGDMRRAFFLAIDEVNVRYLSLNGPIQAAIADGQNLVAAGFITPYPPGFPVLVPGQKVSPEIVSFLQSVQHTEIHGYDPELGLRLFTPGALE